MFNLLGGLRGGEALAVHLTFGITIGLLMVLAVFLFFGKGTILINGMMMMPKEARDKINKMALGRFVGLMLVVINITMALMWIDLAWFETTHYWLVWVSTGLMLAVAAAFIVVGILKRETWFRLGGAAEVRTGAKVGAEAQPKVEQKPQSKAKTNTEEPA